MVRSAAMFAFAIFSGVMLAGAAAAPAEDKPMQSVETRAPGIPDTALPRWLPSPATRVTACELCAGLTCATVRVEGSCTVKKAVAALRRQRAPADQADKRVSERPRHRERAVSRGDFSGQSAK